jgi:hypothetical protein
VRLHHPAQLWVEHEFDRAAASDFFLPLAVTNQAVVLSHGLVPTLADPRALLAIVAQLLTDGNGTLAIVSWRVAAHVSRATLADEMSTAHPDVQLTAAGEVHGEGARMCAIAPSAAP